MQPILHHYPPSPVSEKVRVAFGMKNLSWRSVEIPRLPPRPLLFPMTGGYRRTPVLQIGADIYCDSTCILRAIKAPGLDPDQPGELGDLVWAVGRWVDDILFPLALTVVLGHAPDALAPEFAKDRGQLYFGPDFDLQELHRRVPDAVSQLRAQLAWVSERFADGRHFITGNEPSVGDCFVYYLLWFICGRWDGGSKMIGELAGLSDYMKRVEAIGHGEETAMSGEDALALAATTAASGPALISADNPLGLSAGDPVGITPDAAGLDPIVYGQLVHWDDGIVGINRADPQCGDVRIYFPQVGYKIMIGGSD